MVVLVAVVLLSVIVVLVIVLIVVVLVVLVVFVVLVCFVRRCSLNSLCTATEAFEAAVIDDIPVMFSVDMAVTTTKRMDTWSADVLAMAVASMLAVYA